MLSYHEHLITFKDGQYLQREDFEWSGPGQKEQAAGNHYASEEAIETGPKFGCIHHENKT